MAFVFDMPKLRLPILSLGVVVFVLLLMGARAHGTNSCEALFSGHSIIFTDGPLIPQKPIEIQPRPRDLEIPAEREAEIIEQAKRTNLSPFYFYFRPTMRRVSDDDAMAFALKIKSRIQNAAHMVKGDDLNGAINALNDPNLIRGSGFWTDAVDEIFPDQIGGDDEHTYANYLVRSLPRPPRVELIMGSIGRVIIPHPPEAASCRNHTKLKWAQREWIRIAAEEFGHVAQILAEHSNPDRRFLSQMFSPESSVVRSTTSREGEALNAERGRLIPWLMEGDIYAFMIETFGPEMIPVWFATDSGYVLREHVDRELTRRGVPGREWPNPQ